MFPHHLIHGTFSILGYDPRAQEWGVAVQSKSFAVGTSVPWARAGVGAVATQAWTNKAYGTRGLALLKRGHDPKDVIAHLVAGDKLGSQRQLTVMDAQGRTANYTGKDCPSWAGGIAEQNVSVQGNIIAGERVLKAMLAAFNKTGGKLAARLIAALEAGQAAGGDTRGQQSAALLVVRAKSDEDGKGDVYVDVRVDDHETPIAELKRTYGVWEHENYPYLESNYIQALLREKKYARAQRVHRDFAARAEELARKYRKDATLFNGLAWYLSRTPLGLDAALKFAKHAVRLKPKEVNLIDTLAEVHFQRGEYERAIELEQPLVARRPDRADLNAQLKKFEKGARRARR